VIPECSAHLDTHLDSQCHFNPNF